MTLLEAVVEMARDKDLRIKDPSISEGIWYSLDEFLDSIKHINFIISFMTKSFEVKSIQEIERENKKEEPFKLEVGCYYEARNGLVYFIYRALPKDHSYDFLGFEESDDPEYCQSFLSDGCFCVAERNNRPDLIKKLPDQKWPWVEELRKKLCS